MFYDVICTMYMQHVFYACTFFHAQIYIAVAVWKQGLRLYICMSSKLCPSEDRMVAVLICVANQKLRRRVPYIIIIILKVLPGENFQYLGHEPGGVNSFRLATLSEAVRMLLVKIIFFIPQMVGSKLSMLYALYIL